MPPELPTRKTSSHIISAKSGLGITNNREAKREGERPWRTKSGRRSGRRNWNRTNGKRGGKRFFALTLPPFPFLQLFRFQNLSQEEGDYREGEGGGKNFPCGGAPFTNGICAKNGSWTSVCLVKASSWTHFISLNVGKSLPLLGGGEK